MADDDIRLTKRETAIIAACLCDELAERLRQNAGNYDASHQTEKNDAARIVELVNRL